MEQREPPKSVLKREMDLDRISNLPSDIIGQILSLVTIREAARTSVLSSNWRYKSAMLPNLVFDSQHVSTRPHTTIVNIVDHVLLGHIGPIHKFKFASSDAPPSWVIDRWILHLSRNSIKELSLGMREGHYNTPSCLFSCQDMIDLQLFNCLLKPPSALKDFRNLKTVNFQGVTIAEDVLKDLIAGCPLLERLILTYCYFIHLIIDAPNLQFLDVEGDFEDVIFKNTFNLSNVSLNMNVDANERWVPDNSSNLVKFCFHLPRVQMLLIDGYFLKFLSVGVLPEKLPKPCLHLRCLEISINFKLPKEILTALCFLRSCPALRELKIHSDNGHEDDISESEVNSLHGDQLSPSTQLRHINVDITSTFAELNFIRFLLLNSPVLEKMIVQPIEYANPLELAKDLLQFKRASANAEIFFLDA